MRIAVSGAHRTGKTTLIDALIEVLPTYTVVDEPYYLLEAEGHAFAELPSLADFELQLERSITCLHESEGAQLFDRCPADLLAYLITHRDAANVALGGWLRRARAAMRQLDIIVFVPIEQPDRISVAEHEERRLRRRVDAALQEIVLEDRWGFGIESIAVTGSVRQRVAQVVAYMRSRARPAAT